MSVGCTLGGRMGNHMFQMAAAAGYAQQYGLCFNIPDTWTHDEAFPATKRLSRTRRLKHVMCIPDAVFDRSYYELPDPGNRCKSTDIVLDGDFQSHRYFHDCEKTIRFMFTFNASIRKASLDRMSRLKSTKYRLCAVHLRLKDYTNSMNCLIIGSLDRKYYWDAMCRVHHHYSEKVLFVFFSDDRSACESFVKTWGLSDCFNCIMSPNAANSGYDDMADMGHYDALVISNSTFAWWCAWLNNTPNKYVVAPWPWFTCPILRQPDIIPSSWHIEDSYLHKNSAFFVSFLVCIVVIAVLISVFLLLLVGLGLATCGTCPSVSEHSGDERCKSTIYV